MKAKFLLGIAGAVVIGFVVYNFVVAPGVSYLLAMVKK